MRTNKVIPSERLEEVRRWESSDTQGGSVPKAGHGGLHTEQQLEALREQARSEGFQQGRAEGLAAGAKEIGAKVKHLDGLMRALARPFEELDDKVEHEVVALAMAVGRHLVRREFRTNPKQIVAVVQEALGAVPVSCRRIRLALNPEDARLVREALPPADGDRAWELVEDPVIPRGGCRVHSESCEIDATLDTRVNAIIAAVMGGGREGDRRG